MSSTDFTVTVTDGDGSTVTDTLALAVGHPALQLTLSETSVTLTRGTAMTPITASATGGDESYAFSIAPALPAGLILDTATGTISGTPAQISGASGYLVTVVDGTGATGIAALTLGVTENGERVVEAFTEATAFFIANRMDQILSSEPQGYRFDRRSAGMNAVVARADDNGALLRFSGSHVTSDNAWQIWMEGAYAGYRTRSEALPNHRGEFAMMSFGADYLLTPALAFGMMGQFDWASERSPDRFDLSGQGWLVGPYLSGQLAPDLFFTLRGAVGGSNNAAEVNVHADATPWFDGSFDTRRTLLRASIYGTYEWGSGLSISPEVDLAWMREQQASYPVNDGTTAILVPGQTIERGRLTLSTLIEDPLPGDREIFFVRPALAWDFAASGAARSETLRGSVEFGVRTGVRSEWNGSGSVRFDGIGSDWLTGSSIRLSLSRQF